MTARPAPLPGAVAISHLRPYSWPASDGVSSGSPHVHLACVEAYVVTGGRGAVETLTMRGGYREIELVEGAVVWFTPGTVHRMVERHGLRVTVLMQNSGLTETGDAVFTFPPELLRDPGAYEREAFVPPGNGPDAERAARRRRDLAIAGYLELRHALVEGDHRPLQDFLRAATELVGPRVSEWVDVWRGGPLAAAERTGRQIDALIAGDGSHLADAEVEAALPANRGGFGMCGRRDEYRLPAAEAGTRP
jgi:hypothetical protein